MNDLALQELRQYRRSFAGQLKNLLVLLAICTGFVSWLGKRNLWLAIPMMLLTPVALNLPTLVYRKSTWIHGRYNLNLLKTYEFSLLLIIAYSTAGSAYLFYLPYQFDILVHYTENFLFALLLVLAANIIRIRRGKAGYSAGTAAWTVIFTGIGFALFWEGYQISCDYLFKTGMTFDSVQSWLQDSVSDMAGGLLGLAVFTPLIVLPFWETLNAMIRRSADPAA